MKGYAFTSEKNKAGDYDKKNWSVFGYNEGYAVAKDIIDAMLCGTGPYFHSVKFGGGKIRFINKVQAQKRTYTSDAVDLSGGLYDFARNIALDIAQNIPLSKEAFSFLITGDEETRIPTRDETSNLAANSNEFIPHYSAWIVCRSAAREKHPGDGNDSFSVAKSVLNAALNVWEHTGYSNYLKAVEKYLKSLQSYIGEAS